jgi:hypothetical protein
MVVAVTGWPRGGLLAVARPGTRLSDQASHRAGGIEPDLVAKASTASWGQIATRNFSIEVNMGSKEPVESITLHVRGGDAAIGLIADILDRLNTRALDIQTGEMLDKNSAVTSLTAWRAYRDQVVNPPR